MIEIVAVTAIDCDGKKHQVKKNGLLPCPHCGGEAAFKTRVSKSLFDQGNLDVWCECKNCHARTKAFVPEMENPEKAMENIELAKAHAIDAWNMRS